MKPKLMVFLLLTFSIQSFAQSFHQKAILIDTHNDVLSGVTMKGMNLNDDLYGKTHSDINRFIKGGVDVQIFSIFCDERFGKDTAFKYANIEIDSLYAIAGRNKSNMMIAKNYKEVEFAIKHKKIAALMGVEGGHMIEDKLSNLDAFAKRGAKYMTLTWNNSTSWATSAWDETHKKDSLPHKGLTDFGKQVVKRMNTLGMMVDLSHVGEQTFWDAINTTTKPVIVSHSCCYSLCPVPRNLKDEQIIAVGKNDGVICVNFYAGFVDSTYNKKLAVFLGRHTTELDSLKNTKAPNYAINEFMAQKYPQEAAALRPPLSMLISHIDHIVQLAGIDHVGLGSDFDGIEAAPLGLDGVQDFPNITDALLQHGYSKKDVLKILGGNVLRVLKANETTL